jgi:hypothetical protein
MYEEVETAAITTLETQLPDPPPGPTKQLLSVDGAYVPLVHGEWVEVKTVAIGVIGEPVLKKGELVVQSKELSYFSRRAEAAAFERLALVETHRRGVETAEHVIAPTDGAVWIQGFLDYHRPDAERILDFGHAAEYVTRIGRVIGEPESEAFKTWLAHNLHMLKHEGGTAVLPELRAQVATHPNQPELAEALAYLENRVTMMNYPEYQRQGWPIGSGSVESANKVVVEARLKGAGMHWAPEHVNPMLSLRGAVCSHRWHEAWQDIATHHQQQRHQAYRERARLRTIVPLPPLLRPAPESTVLAAEAEVPPTEPKPRWRPAPDHPWRRSLGPTSSRRSRFAEK